MKNLPFWRTVRNIAVYSLFSVTAMPVIWLAGTTDAEAVPAFARKYDTTCNVCHTRQPRLNPFGQRFMENGYQMPGTADGGTKEKYLLGGELNGATLDDISNYMAVRLRADIQQASFKDTPDGVSDDPDIVFPNIINVFFAGTATEDISFFMEMEYNPVGGESALVFERAYLSFNNLFAPQMATVKIGNFDPSSMYSFPTHRQMINPVPPIAETTGFPPGIGRVPLLPLAFASKMFGLTRGPGLTQLTGGMGGGLPGYQPDNGQEGFAILPFEPMFYNAPAQKGISVHGRPFGNSFLYQVGVVQAQTAEDIPKTTFDPYIMLRYDIIGSNSNLQFSGFYYTASKAARATLRPSMTDVVFAKEATDWQRMGIGARWQYKSLDIYGTYIVDEIDEPTFGGMPGLSTSVWETTGSGLSLEADYLLTKKWLLGARYDMMKTGGLSRLPGQAVDAPDLNQDASFIALIGKYYPTPSIGLYGRYHMSLEDSVKSPIGGGVNESPVTNFESFVSIGVDMAF